MNIREELKHTYYHFIYEKKEELEKSQKLVSVIDSIEYRTKKNGKTYAKTEDNISTTFNCHLRFDRGFKWLEVHGASAYEMYTSHYVAVFDCKQSLDGLKAEISNYRKRLVNGIEEKEQIVKMTFDEFIKEGLKSDL